MNGLQLLRVALSPEAIAEAARTGAFMIRMEVDAALPGGLAIYGARFGRYPLDPTVQTIAEVVNAFYAEKTRIVLQMMQDVLAKVEGEGSA